MKCPLLTFAILVFYSSTVSANTELSLAPSLIYFDYTEYNTVNQELNNETGLLPGINAELRHWINPHWSVGIFSSYHDGTVDYDGQTQSGTSFETDTTTRLFRLGLRADYMLRPDIGLLLSVQSHEWTRDINDKTINGLTIYGLSEVYQWTEYAAGIAYYKNLDSRNTITTRASVLLVRNADIYVDLSRIGYGNTDLDIGDGSGARLDIEWHRQHNASTRYGIALFVEGWDFGRSNTRPTSGGATSLFVTEPRSETRNFGIRLIYNYAI